MTDIQTLLTRCRELGAEFISGPGGKLKVRALAPLPEDLQEQLRQHKSDVLALLARPYVNARGELIIPFECNPKYHYWKPGGQSLAQTLTELSAPAEVWLRYVRTSSQDDSVSEESAAVSRSA
jgi:hypothetical protein